MIYPLFADTNVQKKAKLLGYDLSGYYSPPLFHINHGSKGWGGGGFADGINKKQNNIHEAIHDLSPSRNNDTWGFSDIDIQFETF